MKVEIYSDIACPWCYIGERRFKRALEAFGPAKDIEVVFRPYQLDPGAPAQARPLKEYLEGRFGSGVSGMLERVNEAASGEGITMDWDRAQSVNTVTAHRLMGLAEREYDGTVQGKLAEALFALHFSEGEDVSDHDALTRVAVAAGMDEERVQDYLASGEGQAQVEADFQHARQLGIQAVPTFVFDGKYAVQGGQPVSTFLRTLEEVEAAAKQSPEEGDGAAACDDGACAV